jgi:hypothetical protein
MRRTKEMSRVLRNSRYAVLAVLAAISAAGCVSSPPSHRPSAEVAAVLPGSMMVELAGFYRECARILPEDPAYARNGDAIATVTPGNPLSAQWVEVRSWDSQHIFSGRPVDQTHFRSRTIRRALQP